MYTTLEKYAKVAFAVLVDDEGYVPYTDYVMFMCEMHYNPHDADIALNSLMDKRFIDGIDSFGRIIYKKRVCETVG